MTTLGRQSKLVIRLSLRGCTNRPFYHIVVMNNRQGRDAKVKCQLGVYDPMPNTQKEVLVSIDFDKLRHYVSRGVTLNKSVAQLLGLAGYLPICPTTRLEAFRKQRQEAEKAEAEAAAAAEGQQAAAT